MVNPVPKDVHEAFRQVCYDFGTKDESGPERLGRMMGISPGTLYNKCNVNETSHHKPTMAECVIVTLLTGDKRIAQAFSRTVGGVFVDLPDLSDLSTDALMLHLLRIQQESGHFHGKLNAALETDGISKHEYGEIEREAHEFIAAILESLVRIKEMSGGAK